MIHYAIKCENWGTRIPVVLLDEAVETEAQKTQVVAKFMQTVLKKIEQGGSVVNPSISRFGCVLRNKYGERESIWINAYEVSDLPEELDNEPNEER